MIVEVNKHHQAFHSAHNDVIEHLGGVKAIFAMGSYCSALKQGWKELHNVDVPGPGASWSYLVFANEDDYLLWLLKYSR